ncbi:MAG: ADP-ribose pyrophosphatase [Chlamydiae bacterium]|nr:ADP-ribose pyrophosphatase [Chlamydiota bacterium]
MENALKQKQLEDQANLQTKELYKGKIFSLRRDHLQFDAGPPHDWDIIEHPGAVAIIPVNEKGNFIFVQQWRRAIEKIIYELPAGTLDEGENPLLCAQRELQEETGYRAKEIIPFGGIYSAPGFCTEYIHFFIARDLEESPLPGDLHEAIDVVEVSLNDALAMIDSQQISDAKTIVGILRYQRWKSHA